jgi:signal peptidase I
MRGAAAAHLRSALDGTLRALSVLSLLLFAFLAIGPHTGLYRPATVLSDSMRPTFSHGDLVITTPEPLDHLRVGQVLSFRIPVGDHRVESHRIVEILASGLAPVVRTRGDASQAPDPWNAQLTGEKAWVVSAAVPKLGWLIIEMRDPRIRLLALFLAPALLASRLLLQIWLPGRRRAASSRRRAPFAA